MNFSVLALVLFLSQAQARTLVVRDNCDRNLNNETTIDPSCDVPSTMPGDGVIHAAYWRDHGTPHVNSGNPERPDRRGFHGFYGVNGTNGVHGTNGVNGTNGVHGAYGAGASGSSGNGFAWVNGSLGTTNMATGANRPQNFSEAILNPGSGADDGNINGVGNNGNFNSGSFNNGNRNTGNANSGNYNIGDVNSGNSNLGSGNSGNFNTGSLNSGSNNLGDANSGNWNDGNLNSGNSNRGNLNSGDWNAGNLNSGNMNTGNANSGSFNLGDLNSGDWNTGNLNSGDRNIGNLNSGDYNLGDLNSGNNNTGSLNSGNGNIGNLNSGNRNLGNLNSGNRNIGDLNSGNRNLGNLNSGNRNIGNLNSGNRNFGSLNSGNRNIGNLNSGNRNLGNLNSGNRNIGNLNSGNRNIGNLNSGNNNIGNLNSGNRNLGNLNSGDRNIGNLNSGDRNIGNLNSGNNNIGNVNSGDHNLGNFNSGNRNLGDFNSGDRNIGFANSGDRNLGAFNSGNRNIGFANSGDANLGSFNSGNSNEGNWNSGSRNLGDHNLGNSNVGNSNDGDRNIGNSNVGNDNTGNTNTGNRNIGDSNLGDDNYGDSNRGNGNDGDGNRGNYHVGDYNEDEKKLYAHVVPVVFGNIDGMDRVENLTPQDSYALMQNGSMLDLDDYRAGFFVQKSRKYDIGLGVGTVMGFDRAGDVFTGLVPFSASVGLAVTKGSTVTFSTYVESEDEIESAQLRIPFSGTELASWKKGDSVIYESTGGLQLSGSVGYWGVSLGGALMLEGSYKTQVQKLGGSIASLDVMVGDTKGVTLVGGGYGVAGAISYLKQKGKRFKFVIDLSDKEARMAYQAAMVGWLAPLQRLAEKPVAIASVIKIETEKSLLKGHTMSLGMTSPIIPLVSLRVAKSEFYQHSYVVNHVGCFQTETEYGIYTKEKKARIFALHAGTNTAFYGGLAKLTECGKVVDTDMSGFFTWQYENDYSKTSRLDRNINELKRLTGLGSLVDVAVQEGEKLGFVNADFRVKFPKAYTLYLIKTAQAGRLDSIKEKALLMLGDYLKSGQDLYGICDSDKSMLCVAGRTAKINSVFKKIEKILVKMGETTDSKEFANEFAELGEKIWDNQFTFKAFFEEGKKCGVSLDFKVAGRRISLHKKSLSYPVTLACSVR